MEDKMFGDGKQHRLLSFGESLSRYFGKEGR